MILSVYDFRVSTISWGNIFDLRVVAYTKDAAKKLVEEKYKDWRVQDMGKCITLKEGVFL